MDKLADARSRAKKMRTLLKRYNQSYYQKNAPEVADSEYDRLLKELAVLENKFPSLKTKTSPTQKVGGMPSGDFSVVAHARPMLSLGNAFSFEEVQAFFDRCKKGTGLENIQWVTELKYDGLAVSLVYENGLLARGATRGDGRSGDDITDNIRTLGEVPHRLASRGSKVEGLVEIRGEVFLNRADLDAINAVRELEDEAPFVNPRNAAAGSLKMKDSKKVSKRPLRFVVYELVQAPLLPPLHSEGLKLCKKWGLPISHGFAVTHNLDSVWKFCQRWEKDRQKLEFDADGIVIKADSLDLRKVLGFTSKSPRWAMAYKFSAEKVSTKLLGIRLQVGRSGVMTPVADLEPVLLEGATIKKATLHNEDEIKRLRLRVGDWVQIERSGGVIPKILGPVLGKPRGPKAYQMPKKCPSCLAPTLREADETARRCLNLACPAQLQRKIEHFVSKGGLDIEGLGPRHIESLIAGGHLKGIADIFGLDAETIASIEGLGQKSAEKLVAAIADSKSRGLGRLLFALGLRHVGIEAARSLALEFRTMEKLTRSSSETLAEMNDIGPAIARSIVDFFSRGQNLAEVRALVRAGVLMKSIERKASGGLLGMRLVFTGALSSLGRKEAEARAKALGAKVSSTVSAKTSYLILGNDPGSKAKRAQKLGLKIMREKEFLALLESALS